MRYIERKKYLNRLIKLKGTPDIKIITGMHRSWKSELLKAYIDYLEKNYDETNIIRIDSETLEREISPLKSIRDSYPKMLIANTKHEKYDIEGIEVWDISKWLAKQ